MQGSITSVVPSSRNPMIASTPAWYIQPADPVYQVQPPHGRDSTPGRLALQARTRRPGRPPVGVGVRGDRQRFGWIRDVPHADGCKSGARGGRRVAPRCASTRACRAVSGQIHRHDRHRASRADDAPRFHRDRGPHCRRCRIGSRPTRCRGPRGSRRPVTCRGPGTTGPDPRRSGPVREIPRSPGLDGDPLFSCTCDSRVNTCTHQLDD